MDRLPIFILKTAVICLAIFGIFTIRYLMIPIFGTDDLAGYRPILIGVLISAIPYYSVLISAYRLLFLIDHGQVNTSIFVNALDRITFASAFVSLGYILGLPYIYLVANRDDAPGIILIALVIIALALTVASVARLCRGLIILKSAS